MIVSASRRTDVPAYYADWFINRIHERFAYVRNPMNGRQIREVSLAPEAVECIVFWSKNPRPMLEKLEYIKEYAYYFQYTLNPYDADIEANLPDKRTLLETFKRLSDRIGPDRVVWRYDPVLLSDAYTVSYHKEKFYEFSKQLKGYTNKVIFSFIDIYKKTAKNTALKRICCPAHDDKLRIARAFSRIAGEHGLRIETCAEDIDLSAYAVARARCIDGALASRLAGRAAGAKKDARQRPACGCAESVDIGAYNSCLNGCVYCYANYGGTSAVNNIHNHSPSSPLLIGNVDEAVPPAARTPPEPR